MDSDDRYLAEYDLIITTSEKLDSLIRHSAPWINKIGVLVVDEIHLLNDQSRGPTLEILLTILTTKNKNLQIIGLSATIGNPEQLSEWLGAELVEDSWRPVELRKGIFHDGEIKFYN
jgi:helicase